MVRKVNSNLYNMVYKNNHSTHVEKQEAKLRFMGENTFIKHQQ